MMLDAAEQNTQETLHRAFDLVTTSGSELGWQAAGHHHKAGWQTDAVRLPLTGMSVTAPVSHLASRW